MEPAGGQNISGWQHEAQNQNIDRWLVWKKEICLDAKDDMKNMV